MISSRVPLQDFYDKAPFSIASGETEKPLKSTNLTECGVSDWDSEYVNIEQEVLLELLSAAFYLHIKSLLDLTCAKVVSMTREKNTEEIRKGSRSSLHAV